METPKEDIEGVLTSFMRRIDEELFAMSDEELSKKWNFKWDDNAGVEWNTYKFSDMLEMYKRSCRRWEEHHNGSFCVVERVREKYIMPKVRAFLTELAKHNVKVSDSPNTEIEPGN